MQAKKYDEERLEAIRICRQFRRMCLEQQLYLRNDISRTEYAHLMNTNHVYLCRKIKIASGFTMCRFIKSIRLTIAYKMLSQTNVSMTTVLAKSGFTDKTSFYRCFNQRFHCSPTELRKQYFAN